MVQRHIAGSRAMPTLAWACGRPEHYAHGERGHGTQDPRLDNAPTTTIISAASDVGKRLPLTGVAPIRVAVGGLHRARPRVRIPICRRRPSVEDQAAFEWVFTQLERLDCHRAVRRFP